MGATQHMEKLSCVILTLQGSVAYESLSLSFMENEFLKKPFWNSFWKKCYCRAPPSPFLNILMPSDEAVDLAQGKEGACKFCVLSSHTGEGKGLIILINY